jgi:hypothetical protein
VEAKGVDLFLELRGRAILSPRLLSKSSFDKGIYIKEILLKSKESL